MQFLKFNYLLIFFYSIFILSCSKKRNTEIIPDVSTKIITGELNIDSNAAPVVTVINAANAPEVKRAGNPKIIKNPNADGLGNPDFTVYGAEQGLMLGNTTAALLDKTGNLWFCSNGNGVSKYDGEKFTVYTAVNGMDNGIYSIAQDTAGNIWFDAGDAILFKYDGKRFLCDSSLVKPAHRGILAMYGDRKGNIWFGSVNGVIKYGTSINNQSGKTTSFTTKQGIAGDFVTCIKEDRSGDMWFGTSSGASRYDGNHFYNYTEKTGLIKNGVDCVEEDMNGNIWFGTDSGVSKFDGSHFTNYTTNDGLISNTINIIKADSLGTIWFGTDKGISKYESPGIGQAPVFTNYSKQNGLTDNEISSITEDQAGSIWIGTGNGGICKYNRNRLTYFTKSLGLIDDNVLCTIQDRQNNLWIGTSGGVSKFDGKSFYNYSKAQGLPNFYIYSLLEDKTGNIWFGGFGYLSKYDGKRFTIYSVAQGIPSSEIWNIFQDRTGNIWFTSWQGVTKYDGKSFTRYKTAQGIVTDEIIAVLQDLKGDMWFSAAGVSKFDGKHFTNYTTKNGMILDEIPALSEDRAGNLWLGSYGKGISKFKNDSLTTYTTTQGIADNTISTIREDSARHYIWVSTNKGLSLMKTVSRSSGIGDSIVFENFNPETGYHIKDFSWSFSLFVDHQGVIWGGSGHEKLIRFDYSHLSLSRKPFQLRLQKVSINNENICWNLLHKDHQNPNVSDSLAILNEMVTTFGKPLSMSEMIEMKKKFHTIDFDSTCRFYPVPQKLVIPYQFNDISFEFSAIEPSFGDQIRYQYMLDGYDAGWSPLSNKTSAEFGNIREGNYTFKLRAVNPSGIWSEINYSFRVLAPWYRTWWAFSLYTLTIIGIFRVISKRREKMLRAENERLENKVEERTNELSHTLDNLKSTQDLLIQSEKMASLGELTAGIAHEIQNPLNFVNNFSELNKELISEFRGEADNPAIQGEILSDIDLNNDKIMHHGKRAEAIVKGMLQHSRVSIGKKESIDINSLVGEYLRLSYQALREKDNSVSISIITSFDEDTGMIQIISQDMGVVFLNIYNNAFYALTQKNKIPGVNFKPVISVSTHKIADKVEIIVRDNGTGIPQKIVGKIFQPFFTTKPTGQGSTGLGLSLTYDIVKANGGTIKVDSKEDEYTEFTIQLPIT
jgi:ligand-binding sensor domain-containing protein